MKTRGSALLFLALLSSASANALDTSGVFELSSTRYTEAWTSLANGQAHSALTDDGMGKAVPWAN